MDTQAKDDLRALINALKRVRNSVGNAIDELDDTSGFDNKDLDVIYTSLTNYYDDLNGIIKEYQRELINNGQG